MTAAEILSARRRLEAEALASARLRGHDMHAPVVDADSPSRSRAFCRRCGRGAYVDTRPMPNGIEIHGEAVALDCEGRRS